MGLAWITCLWPGLPRLWWRGEWTGMVTAATFAAGINAGLFATFVTPDLVSPTWRLAGWSAVAVWWAVCVRRAAARLSQFYAGDGRYNDELFRRAQEEYLKGQWFEAESLLLQLVREEPADVEGRLILATLYRHTRRADLAEAQLGLIERYPHAARWGWEIQQERLALKRIAEVGPDRRAGPSEAPESFDDAHKVPSGGRNLPIQGEVLQEPRLLVNSTCDGEPSTEDAHTGDHAAHGGLSEAA